jgi:ABC-2 type transport system permease protein
MKVRHVGILLKKELVHGSKSFMFIFAIVVPLVLTLIVSLVFGSLFSGKPELGIADQGDSRIPGLAAEIDSMVSQEYPSDAALRAAVEAGKVDVGVVLPAGFDGDLSSGESAKLTAYVWGESLLKDRVILAVSLTSLVRELVGQEPPVEIDIQSVGDGESIPWYDRLLPLIVLLAVMVGGLMIPATSLVDEKQKRTLRALTITPVTLEEVFLTKGLVGALISFVVGVFILTLNRALGAQPVPLFTVLALGALAAGTLGVLLGALMKDIDTLFATVKGTGIFLYAPALVYLFPEIPQWIGKLFPTYYIIGPVVEITQRGGGWSDIASDVLILVGLILALFGVVAMVTRRIKQRDSLA